MLHRMALRVLPSLSRAVTEDTVRTRKRLVMFVPGLVAFGVYRAAKHLLPLTEPWVLLSVSGVVGLVTALLSHRVGRGASWSECWRADGVRTVAWLAGWIGFVYGVQLSLLVLALLWLVGYDYLKHPDGPAMMAIIISCTAVARDAFEIGHVRKIAALGRPFPTFPDGAALRSMVVERSAQVAPWIAVGLAAGALGASFGGLADDPQVAAIVQLAAVTLVGGAVALCAYFGGLRPDRSWTQGFVQTSPGELLKYWWWPGLAFASTYYLVAVGGVIFLLREPGLSMPYAVVCGGVVTAMMALYCYYLGHRRDIEDRQGAVLSSELLRCPFVMGILGKTVSGAGSVSAAPASKG
ncbi:MAG: hypothetical protein U0412_12020 [Nitrospira sp.]